MIAGVATGHLLSCISLEIWCLTLAASAVATGVFLLLHNGKLRPILTTAILLIFFSIGALRVHQCDPLFDSHHWTQATDKNPIFLSLKLKESPIPRERSWKVQAEVEEINNHPCRGELILYLRKDSTAASLRYGDRLLAHGYVDSERKSLYVTSDHYIIVSHDSTSLRARSEALRMKLLERMQSGPLEHRYRGVAEAMTLGWRGDLEPGINAQFRDAGIMHLLCVSGLHIGLLAAIVGGLLFWIGKECRGRLIRGSVQLLALWSFALLTGLSPATVRAALMFSLFIFSNMLGRRTDTLNLLAAAAIAMLMVNPMLLFNTGWQLSFSAVLGILLMRPLINFHRNILWQAAIVSLSATLATLPVTLATFQRFYPYFLIANIIIIPAAGFLLTFSLLYMLLPCGITSFLAEGVISFCDNLTLSISHLPGAVVSNLEPRPWTVALLALTIAIILISINIYANNKRFGKTF